MEEHMSKKTDWGKVVRDTVNDVICAIKNSPKYPNVENLTSPFKRAVRKHTPQ